MEIDRLRRNWENLGKADPMWAILTRPGTEGGKWDEAEFFATGREYAAWLGTWLAEHGIPAPKGRALDFGCGIGRLTQAIAPYFDAVVGVDISEPMVATARLKNRFGERVQYVCNPHPHLRAFADATFDFAQSVIVLQHMRAEYALAYLAEFLRILRPGGLMFVQVITAEREPGAAPPAGPIEATGEAHMEMHCIPVDRLRATLRAQGGEILRDEDDYWAGPSWESRHFLVRRAAT